MPGDASALPVQPLRRHRKRSERAEQRLDGAALRVGSGRHLVGAALGAVAAAPPRRRGPATAAVGRRPAPCVRRKAPAGAGRERRGPRARGAAPAGASRCPGLCPRGGALAKAARRPCGCRYGAAPPAAALCRGARPQGRAAAGTGRCPGRGQPPVAAGRCKPTRCCCRPPRVGAGRRCARRQAARGPSPIRTWQFKCSALLQSRSRRPCTAAAGCCGGAAQGPGCRPAACARPLSGAGSGSGRGSALRTRCWESAKAPQAEQRVRCAGPAMREHTPAAIALHERREAPAASEGVGGKLHARLVACHPG